MSRLVFRDALRVTGLLLGSLLASPLLAQSSEDSRPLPVDIARYANAIQQQSDSADAQLQQGRELISALDASDRDLLSRVQHELPPAFETVGHRRAEDEHADAGVGGQHAPPAAGLAQYARQPAAGCGAKPQPGMRRRARHGPRRQQQRDGR